MKSITSCVDTNRVYIRYLENGEFIISDNHYIKGKNRKWYR